MEKNITIEDKAKAYDKAVKEASIAYKDEDRHLKAVLERIFPELADSKDEGIRKNCIHFLELQKSHHASTVEIEECITWLEKQEKHLKNYDEAEKEKDDFVSGNFIYCHKSFDEFKEGVSYWLEYIGDDTYIGRSDNILNKKFHITPRQLFNLFSLQHNEEQYGQQADDAPLEDSSNSDINDSNVFVPMSYGKEIDEAMYEACRRYELPHTDANKYSLEDVFHAGVRASENKKPEWSDEDEYILGETIQHLEELIRIDKAKHCGVDVQYYQRDIDWLKSIRPQSTWKPSEHEQN